MSKLIDENLIKKIIDLFNSEEFLQLSDIAKSLKIKSDTEEYNTLKTHLLYLTDAGRLNKSSRRRYSLSKAKVSSNFIGVIHFEKNKIYAVANDDDNDVVFIKQRDVFLALDNDTVEIKILREKKGKIFGEVVDIIERAEHIFYAIIEFEDDEFYLHPVETDKYLVDFPITKNNLKGAKIGQKVKSKLVKWDDYRTLPTVEILEIIKKPSVVFDIKKEFDKIVAEFDLNTVFPEDVINEAKKYSLPRNQSSYKGRIDRREDLIVTIDPFDAKDFDDALSLKHLENGNLLLGVHIADVSYYVKENSGLDIEARFRGNSTYLVDRVIPMLPEELSNEICSLKPNEVRFAFSVDIEYDLSLNIVNYNIYESVIKSKRRFTYEEVLQIISDRSGELSQELILPLYDLSRRLRSKRFEQGGIDFSTSEVRFLTDDRGIPKEVVLKKGTVATELVEECMLAANQVVAKHIKVLSEKNNRIDLLPYIYRIHEEPDPKMISDAMNLIAYLVGKKIKKKKFNSKEINDLLHEFDNENEANIVSQILIRSLPKAIYSQQNFGHYGLGFQYYTHFTSPIRRYADLLIHRLIKEYSLGKIDSERESYLKLFVRNIANAITLSERTSMETERAANKVALVLIAENYIGESFEGTITGVTSFGLFVTLEKIYVEGLLHIKDINDDYYHFDEERFSLIGKRTKKIHKIGGKIQVQIVKTSLNKRTIDLLLADNK